jgi:pimeloyl-ACP methyl ester carboxylesterase
MFESLGMTPSVARRVAAANDATMGRCILSLYRSAAQPAMANWGRDLEKAAARPGLVIVATEDHYVGGEALARRSAERAGAEVAVLEGLGHWWMCQDPARGAKVLSDFFDRLP